MRTQVQSLASLSGLRIQRGCKLWCRLAASALIWPLAWEPLYAAGVALKVSILNKSYVKIFLKLYWILFIYFFVLFVVPHLQHVEVPRLGTELELWLPACDTAATTRDPSCICYLHHSTKSLTRWERPGMELECSWILVRFVSTEPWRELLNLG